MLHFDCADVGAHESIPCPVLGLVTLPAFHCAVQLLLLVHINYILMDTFATEAVMSVSETALQAFVALGHIFFFDAFRGLFRCDNNLPISIFVLNGRFDVNVRGRLGSSGGKPTALLSCPGVPAEEPLVKIKVISGSDTKPTA
jgi:hypothetical protein